MVAAHVVLERAPRNDAAAGMARLFEGKLLSSSKVLQGGEIWTDFVIQADGFSRFVVRDIDLRDLQGGRLVQRILEIETYRMMALLGLPHALQAGPVLNAIESDLATLTAADKVGLLSQEQLADWLPQERDAVAGVFGFNCAFCRFFTGHTPEHHQFCQ